MTDDPFAAPPRKDGMRPAEPMGSDAAASPTPATASPAPPTFMPGPVAADAPPPVAGPTPPTPPPPPRYAQPGSGGQNAAPGQPAPQYGAHPPAVNPYPKSWMNIVALVTSLVGIGLAAIIFGHLGVAAANRGEAQYKGLGIAGLVIGYLQVVLGALLILLFVVAFSQGTVTTN